MKWPSYQKDGGCADLGYLEHLVCGRDDFFETVDCIPCSSLSTNSTVIIWDKKPLTEFRLDIADKEEGFVWGEPSDDGGHDLMIVKNNNKQLTSWAPFRFVVDFVHHHHSLLLLRRWFCPSTFPCSTLEFVSPFFFSS